MDSDYKCSSQGFYKLHRTNPIGAYELIPDDERYISDMLMGHHVVVGGAAARGRYTIHPSSYPWVRGMWKWYLKKGDIPRFVESKYRKASSEKLQRLVSIVLTHVIWYSTPKKVRCESQCSGPFRADSMKELKTVIDTIVDNTNAAYSRIVKGNKRVKGGVANQFTNEVQAIMFWNDGTYDVKQVSPKTLMTMLDIDINRRDDTNGGT